MVDHEREGIQERCWTIFPEGFCQSGVIWSLTSTVLGCTAMDLDLTPGHAMHLQTTVTLLARFPHPLIGCNVCLVQGSSTILLVVQEDKTNFSVRDLEPQVITEAIATFQCNNCIRARLGQTELDSMTIPCIAMIGTRPIFYLVPVTRELSEAVAEAQYPHAYGGPEMRCGIQQPSSQRGYGNPGFSTSRSPALYRLSHSRRGPLVGLYDSGGDGTLICCNKGLEYNVPTITFWVRFMQLSVAVNQCNGDRDAY